MTGRRHLEPTTGGDRLLERRDTLRALATEGERTRSGSGRLVLISGATGTGRSALLDAAAEQAARQGLRVLTARCSTEPAWRDLAPVRQLLGGCTDFGGPAEPADGAAADVGAELWARLRSSAATGPLLLAVDDVHWADAATRRWFTEAARRLDRLPILLLATERSQYDIDAPDPGLAHSLSPARFRRHVVAPLSRRAAEQMVRAELSPGAGRELVDACLRAGTRIPLLLRALLDDLRTMTGQHGEALPEHLPEHCSALHPSAYAAAVAWWLDSAGPGTTTVARALAELEETPAPGEDIGELLAGAAGVDPARLPGWIEAMVRLGVLRRAPGGGRFRFAHALLRTAVLEGWPLTERQQMHRRAAELRHRRGHRVEEVAGHLLQSPPVGSHWAADHLLSAGVSAAREGRTGDALARLRRALDEPMPRERRASALSELGALEFGAAQSGGIPRLTEALRLHVRPRDRVRTAVELGTALTYRGDAHEALALLSDLGGRLPDSDPALNRAVRAAAGLLSDHSLAVRRKVYDGMRAMAERSPEALGPAERALLIRYESTAGLISAQQAMRRIRALLAAPVDPLEEPYLLGTAAAVAQWGEDLDGAGHLVRRALDEHRLPQLHPVHRALLNTRADTAAALRGHTDADGGLSGFLDPALRPEGGDPGRPSGAEGAPAPTNLDAHTLLALTESGRLAEARRLLSRLPVREAHDGWEVNRFLYARGVFRTAAGDLVGALCDFLECGRRQSARGVLSPVVTPWRSAAAECYLALGQPGEAVRLAEEEHRLATRWDTPRVTARSLRVLGEATGGRRGLDFTAQAVEILREEEALGTELLPALIARGRQLTAAGRPGQARPVLREAAALAERLGAVRRRADAQQALRDGGARRSAARLTGADALTLSERRIAGLAADGHTNAEIAALLHLARRTVETHLTSAYRKLGVRRAELPTALAASAP